MYNILIVDDERIERNGIIMLLKRLSINAGIVEAANGKEAYEYLCSDEAEHIDILLTDVKMPFMDGITLIKKLNEDNIKLKTIIFSGYNEFEYAKLAGADFSALICVNAHRALQSRALFATLQLDSVRQSVGRHPLQSGENLARQINRTRRYNGFASARVCAIPTGLKDFPHFAFKNRDVALSYALF